MTATDNSLLLDHALTALRRPRHSLARTLARITSGTLGALALVAAAGAAYEAIASAGDATAYPPAGRLVDVGGYNLHLDCRGEGSP
ncbi:MAG: thioesterase domain protein, partial [Devosia sp.]|nr:thioesterase domain protein [Devosia sp.]